MATIQEIRSKHPEYNDLSDEQLADSLHKKYYSDIPKDEFYSKIGFEKPSLLKNIGRYELGGALGIAQGLGDIGASALNIPSNLYEHYTGEVPYHVPHPNLRQYYPEGWGQIGGKAGEISSGFSIPGFSSLKAIKFAENIPGIKGALARVGLGSLAGGSTAAATNEGDRAPAALLGALFSGGVSAIPELYQGGKSAYDFFKKPLEEKKSLVNQILQSAKDKLSSEENLQSAQQNARDIISKESKANLSEEKQSKKNIESVFPKYSESESNKLLQTQIGSGLRDIHKDFNKKYDAWGEEYGSLPIHEPYTIPEHELSSLGVGSKAAREVERGVKPEIQISKLVDENGKPLKLLVPGKNSTANDYLKFYRTSRDLASNAYNKAVNASTQADKEAYLNLGHSLKRISQDAYRRLNGTLPENAQTSLNEINSGYGPFKTSLDESSALGNIYYNKKVNPNVAHELITQPMHEWVHGTLMQKQPKYLEALRSAFFRESNHPLTPKDLTSQASSLINRSQIDRDAWNLLTPQQKEFIQNHINVSTKRDYINKMKSALNQGELDNIVDTIAASRIKGYSPKVKSALEAIKAAKGSKQEISNQAKKINIDKLELQRIMTERNNLATHLIKKGLHHIGAGSVIDALSHL